MAFASQGVVFISLTTRLPDTADRWDLGELELSVLLLMMVLLAGAGSVLAERLAAHHDSALVLRAGLLVTAVAVPALLLAPVFAGFVLGLAAYGVALGLVDATTNMQAVAVERAASRPLLPSFHAAWTCGGLVGAALTLATSGLPDRSGAVVAVVPLLAALGAFGAYVTRAEVPGTADLTGTGDGTPVPWRPILLVGLGLVVFYMVDTAATTWGATYLDRTVVAPERLVALATFPYLLASLVVRLAGDRLVQRHGVTSVLRVGAVVGCVGLVTVVTAPGWPVAVLGFTVAGAGMAVVAPLSFSAAGRIAGGSPASTDAVIARFNQFNYAGALLGAVLTGVVGSDSLRVGFAVPAVLVLALLPLARSFAAERHTTEAQSA